MPAAITTTPTNSTTRQGAGTARPRRSTRAATSTTTTRGYTKPLAVLAPGSLDRLDTQQPVLNNGFGNLAQRSSLPSPSSIQIKQEPLCSPDAFFSSPPFHTTDAIHPFALSPGSTHPANNSSSLPPSLNTPPTPTSATFSPVDFITSPTSPPSSTSSPLTTAAPYNNNNGGSTRKSSTTRSSSSSSSTALSSTTASVAGTKRKSGSPAVDPATGKPKTTKRRPHSKSRHGCKTCKRRRVKCDETHPICNNCKHLNLECSFAGNSLFPFVQGGLNIMDIRLFHHYTTVVWKTIVSAGISNETIWAQDVPEMAFEYPFLMHSVLTFAANHFSRTHTTDHDAATIDQVVTFHRGDALRLLGEAVRSVTPKNLDALVASSILLILDALANASPPESTSPSSLPASAWLHHVRGAATILTAIGPPNPESRFFNLVNVDLSDLAQGLMSTIPGIDVVSPLECFDEDLQDLYPVNVSSPYYHALVYLDKLFRQRYKSDFILRVFSFPALLDRNLVSMLISGDDWAKRIIRVYYKLVRSFTSEMKEAVWFLEGVSKVLPIDMDQEFGGFGFITQALPLKLPTVDELMESFFNSSLSGNLLNLGSNSTNGSGASSASNSPPTRAATKRGAAASKQKGHIDSSDVLPSSMPTVSGNGMPNGPGNDLDSAAFSLDLLANEAAASELESFASQFMLQATSGVTGSSTTNTSVQLQSQPVAVSSAVSLAGGIPSTMGQINEQASSAHAQDIILGSHSPPTSSSPLSLDSDYGMGPNNKAMNGQIHIARQTNNMNNMNGGSPHLASAAAVNGAVYSPNNSVLPNFHNLPHKLTNLMTDHNAMNTFSNDPNNSSTTITPSMLTVDDANFLIKYEKSN